MRGHSKFLCHGFGINNDTKIKLFDKFVKSGFSYKRMDRKDKGSSVFTCEKKRKHTFTAFNTYSKRRCSEFRSCSMRIPHAVLVADFDKLTEEQKHTYSVLADRDRICS